MQNTRKYQRVHFQISFFSFEFIVWLQVSHSTTQLGIHDSYYSQWNIFHSAIIAYRHEDKEISRVECIFFIFFLSVKLMPGPLNHLLYLRKKYGQLAMLLLKKLFRGETYVPMAISPLSAEEKRQTTCKLHSYSSRVLHILICIPRHSGFFFYICWCSREHRGQSKQPNCLMMHAQLTEHTRMWWYADDWTNYLITQTYSG